MRIIESLYMPGRWKTKQGGDKAFSSQTLQEGSRRNKDKWSAQASRQERDPEPPPHVCPPRTQQGPCVTLGLCDEAFGCGFDSRPKEENVPVGSVGWRACSGAVRVEAVWAWGMCPVGNVAKRPREGVHVMGPLLLSGA